MSGKVIDDTNPRGDLLYAWYTNRLLIADNTGYSIGADGKFSAPNQYKYRVDRSFDPEDEILIRYESVIMMGLRTRDGETDLPFQPKFKKCDKSLKTYWKHFIKAEARYPSFYAYSRNYIQNPKLLDHLFKSILEVDKTANTSPRIPHISANGTQFPKYINLHLHSRENMKMNDQLARHFRRHIRKNFRSGLPTTAAVPKNPADLNIFIESLFSAEYATNHVCIFISTRPGKWFPIHIAREQDRTKVTCLTPDPYEEALITWLLQLLKLQKYKIFSAINDGFCPYGNIMEFIYDKGQGIDYYFDDYIGAIMIAQIAHLNTQNMTYGVLTAMGDNYQNVLRFYKFQLFALFANTPTHKLYEYKLYIPREELEFIEEKTRKNQLRSFLEKKLRSFAPWYDRPKRLLDMLQNNDKYLILDANEENLAKIKDLYLANDMCDYAKLYSLDDLNRDIFNNRMTSRHINPAHTLSSNETWPGRKQ